MGFKIGVIGGTIEAAAFILLQGIQKKQNTKTYTGSIEAADHFIKVSQFIRILLKNH